MTDEIRTLLIRKVEVAQRRNPNILSFDIAVLKDGPRAYKSATILHICDGETREYHHSNLKIETHRKKQGRLKRDGVYSIRLTSEGADGDEIQNLLDFLREVDHLEDVGEYLLVKSDTTDDRRFKQILEAVTTSDRKVELLTEILSWAETDPKATDGLVKLASHNPQRSKSLTAALNYGRYSNALDKFKKMLEDYSLKEPDFQAFLEANYWLFGTEFCELLPSRQLTLGNELDFPLRRTVDGFLDVIEIKTPLRGGSGFKYNDSRNLYSPKSDIYDAISQVTAYVTDLESDRDRIYRIFKIDVSKVKGKIIIGRQGNEQEIQKRRELNNTLKGVEILSFDDLIAIGQRVLDIMAVEHPNLVATENTPSTGETNKSIF